MLILGLQFFAEEPAAAIPQAEPAAQQAQTETAATPPEASAQETPPEQVPQTAVPFSLKVKYNHEERELDEAAARDYAEKGMNYDKVFGEYCALKAKASVYGEIEAQAQAAGMTVEDYIQHAKSHADEAAIQKIADTYSVDYAVAKAIHETRKAPAAATPQATQTADPAPDDKLDADIHALYKAHPDVTEDDVKAIMDDYGKGIPMTAAYEAYKLRKEHEQTVAKLAELEKKLYVKDVNEENNKSAVGSLTSDGETIPNEFYTKEELDSLTREQISANLDKAMASMSEHSRKRK